jgi:hypothetical protein
MSPASCSAAAHNNLQGTLSSSWSSLTNVYMLYLYRNKLNGTLPPSWSNLGALETIGLYTNSLTGTLPSRSKPMLVCT